MTKKYFGFIQTFDSVYVLIEGGFIKTNGVPGYGFGEILTLAKAVLTQPSKMMEDIHLFDIDDDFRDNEKMLDAWFDTMQYGIKEVSDDYIIYRF